jgi:hypothetical protein
VKASNSCARTLIIGSFFLLSFVKFFFYAPFLLFDLAFYCLFSFFDLIFYRPLFSPSFCSCFIHFFTHVISSLAYSTCLGIKWLIVVVVVVVSIVTTVGPMYHSRGIIKLWELIQHHHQNPPSQP